MATGSVRLAAFGAIALAFTGMVLLAAGALGRGPARAQVGVDGQDLIDASQFSMDVWNEVEGSTFEFTYAGESSASACTFNQNPTLDGENVIAFDDLDTPMTTGILGVTCFNIQPIGGSDDFDRLTAFDMELDSTRNWTTTLPSGGSVYDLYTTVLHEFGHALGLGHSPGSPDGMPVVMNATASASQSVRALSCDDEAGVIALYGEPETPDPCEEFVQLAAEHASGAPELPATIEELEVRVQHDTGATIIRILVEAGSGSYDEIVEDTLTSRGFDPTRATRLDSVGSQSNGSAGQSANFTTFGDDARWFPEDIPVPVLVNPALDEPDDTPTPGGPSPTETSTPFIPPGSTATWTPFPTLSSGPKIFTPTPTETSTSTPTATATPVSPFPDDGRLRGPFRVRVANVTGGEGLSGALRQTAW